MLQIFTQLTISEDRKFNIRDESTIFCTPCTVEKYEFCMTKDIFRYNACLCIRFTSGN